MRRLDSITIWAKPKQIYGAKLKFCSYVDLLFAEDDARSSFVKHEAS